MVLSYIYIRNGGDMQKLHSRQEGFTFLELLTVLVSIGILVALVVLFH